MYNVLREKVNEVNDVAVTAWYASAWRAYASIGTFVVNANVRVAVCQ